MIKTSIGYRLALEHPLAVLQTYLRDDWESIKADEEAMINNPCFYAEFQGTKYSVNSVMDAIWL